MPISRAPGWRRLAGRRAALVLLLAPSAACQTWQLQTLPLPGTPAAPVVAAPHARLTRMDGRVDELRDVRVERDTVRGQLLGPRRLEGRAAVPLDSVQKLEVWRVSADRTVGLVVGTLLVAGLVTFATAPWKPQPSSSY